MDDTIEEAIMSIRITNLNEFNRKLKSFINKAELNTSLVTKNIAFRAFRSIVEKTPADTGWALANWNIATGKPDLTVTKKPAKGTEKLDAEPLPIGIGSGEKLPVFYITNNVPYILFLEEPKPGVVFKTPDTGFMVKRTFNVLNNFIDDELRKLRR